MKKTVSVLYAPGFNCEEETIEIVRLAGGKSKLVFINDILGGKQKITACDVFLIPGGFSYGDHIDAGAIVALRLKEYFQQLLEAKIPIGGNCNGNQILVRLGAFGSGISMDENDSGKFCSHPFVQHRIQKSNCIWTAGMEGEILTCPSAHRFGKYVGEGLSKIQTVMTYEGFSPNGGIIAGICPENNDFIFGMMDHPERQLRDKYCIQLYRNVLKAV